MQSYKSLEEWRRANNFNLDNFKAVETTKPVGGYRAASKPIVTISKNGLSLNSFLVKNDMFDYRYVQAYLAAGDTQLMLMFSNEPGPNRYKVSKWGKAKSRRSTVGNLIKELNDVTDCINTKRFRYRFLPTLVDKDHHRLIVDLKSLYAKVIVKKGGK